MNMDTRTVELSTPDGAMPLYEAMPDAPSRAIVVNLPHRHRREHRRLVRLSVTEGHVDDARATAGRDHSK
jgi:hypothetical protein